MCVARHTQSAKNNKFAISLRFLKGNGNDEVDFLPADKRQRFLQSDTVILDVRGLFQHFGHQTFLQSDTIIIDTHDQAFTKYY